MGLEPGPFSIREVGFKLAQELVFQYIWNPRDPAAALSIPPGKGGGEGGKCAGDELSLHLPFTTGATALPNPSLRALGERVPEGLSERFNLPLTRAQRPS